MGRIPGTVAVGFKITSLIESGSRNPPRFISQSQEMINTFETEFYPKIIQSPPRYRITCILHLQRFTPATIIPAKRFSRINYRVINVIPFYPLLATRDILYTPPNPERYSLFIPYITALCMVHFFR